MAGSRRAGLLLLAHRRLQISTQAVMMVKSKNPLQSLPKIQRLPRRAKIPPGVMNRAGCHVRNRGGLQAAQAGRIDRTGVGEKGRAEGNLTAGHEVGEDPEVNRQVVGQQATTRKEPKAAEANAEKAP